MAPKKALDTPKTEQASLTKKGGKGINVESRKKKKKKDPNMPKRAKSAYLFFAMDKRQEVLAQYPHLASKVADVATILGKRWGEALEKEKKKYNILAANDKQRYEAEMAAYKGNKC